MKKLLLYPVNFENNVIIKNRDMLENYELVGAIIDDKTEIDFKEYSGLSHCNLEGFIFYDDFEVIEDSYDTVLFLNGLDKKLIDLYVEKIQLVQSKGKEVLIIEDLYNEINKQGYSIGNVNILRKNVYHLFNGNFKKLEEVDVPIIGILGEGEQTNKFNIQLSIGRYFKGKGYKVLQIGTKEYSELFGFNYIPEFIFSNKVGMTDKIISFNKYVYDLYTKENPDLIILGIPGAIMSYNDRVHYYFGEVPYIICNAVKLDVSILSMFFGETPNMEFINRFRDYCKFRYNCIVNYINISNVIGIYNLENNNGQLEYLHLSDQYYMKKIDRSIFNNKHIFSDVNSINLNEILDSIYNELTNNIEVI